MKEMLKSIGVMSVTGAMAIAGFVVGLMTFNPECVTFKNKENKNEEAE